MQFKAAVSALILACAPALARAAPVETRAAVSSEQAVDTLLDELQRISTASRCRTGAEVTEAERAPITAAGMDAMRRLNADDGAGIYGLMGQEAKAQFPVTLVSQLVTMLRSFGPFLNPQVSSIYVIDARDIHEYGKVHCPHPAQAAGAPGEPILVTTLEDPREAHIQIESVDAEQRRWIMTLWLVERGPRWEVLSFDVHNTGAGRYGAAEMLTMARTERAAGHQAAALALYRAAGAMLGRGQHFTLPEQVTLARELEDWRPGAAAIPQFPFSWQDGASGYSLLNLDVDWAEKKIWLRLTRLTSIWPGDEAIEAENRRILASFRKTQMDGAPGVFDGLEMMTVTADGQHAWITRVSDTDTGQRRA